MHTNSPETRNLIAAMALSLAVMLGWEYFIAGPQRDDLRQAQQAKQAEQQTAAPQEAAPSLPGSASAEAVPQSRAERLAAAPRVRIDSPAISGSINLEGLRIDDVILKRYDETVSDDAPPVTLLSPAGGEESYFAEFGWVAANGDVRLPDKHTRWSADREVLRPGETLTARWENGQGLVFERRITLDDEYLFTVTQRVVNQTGEDVTLFPYGLISRHFKDEGDHFFILHEGPLGVFNETLEEVSYESLRDDGTLEFSQVRGWLGITDKYWLTALVPGDNAPMKATMQYSDDGSRYQVDYTAAGKRIASGETAQTTSRFFAGAKKVTLLDQYAQQYGIPLFDRAVDFGWLYFLTKPIFYALKFFNDLLGNFGLAILALTVCIKLVLFPLANKSYHSMAALKELMPKITEIKERYKDDRMAMNQAVMKLYQQEKVNPVSGCLPMLVQIPIFFALYKVLFVTIEMRHADFYGWINDLSAPDPTSVFNLFGLIPWDPPGFLMIGAWPLIMCATMVIQMRLNPKPADPAQALVMQWMPFIFLFLFASFPAGLVIYWAWNNTLSVIQQWVIMKRHAKR